MWGVLGEAIDALSADDGAALHRRARRGRAGVLARQRHRRVRDRALEQGAGDRVRQASMHRTAEALAHCRHPLVAQIHGICVGGGLEIAALCDLRICGESSRFGAPIKNLGLVMAYAGDGAAGAAGRARRRARDPARGPHLRRRRGEGEGARHARRARRRGRGRGARDGASASPRARRWSRAGTRSSRAGSRRARRSTDAEHDECFDCFDTEDFRIGYAAFLAKRKPAFVGRWEPRNGGAGPLAGMRVLELAQIMAGPTAGMMLADMGADVVKVEKLPGGDDSRGYREPRVNGVSAPFMMLNRNKRGIALDLKQPDGRDDPAAPGARRRRADRELPPRHAGEARPRLRRARGGQSGPHLLRGLGLRPRRARTADKGGFDLIAQGFAGLMSITGEPGGPPVKTGNSVADINAGILAVVGILAAYAHKLRTGRGPGRRHVADGGGAAADLLARGDLLRDRRVARDRPARRTS